MRPFDPQHDFIVVRRARDGQHEHVSLADLDRLMESIGASKAEVAAIAARGDDGLAARVAALEARYESQERAVQALAQGLDAAVTKLNAIIDLADDLVKRRAA